MSLSLILIGAVLFFRQLDDGEEITEREEKLQERESLDVFPTYPGATEESSYTTEGDNKATSIVWKTDDSISEVSSFYNKELEMGGWEITSIIENENSTTFSFTRGESYGFAGIGKGKGDFTIISVTIGLRD